MSEPDLDRRHIAALTAVAIGLTGEAAARRYGIASRNLRRVTAEATRRLGAASPVHAAVLATLAGYLDPEHIRARTLPHVRPEDLDRRMWRLK